jgi:hypothetical protein
MKLYKSYMCLKSSEFRSQLLSQGVNGTPHPLFYNKSASAWFAAVTTRVSWFTGVSTERHNKEYHVLKTKQTNK